MTRFARCRQKIFSTPTAYVEGQNAAIRKILILSKNFPEALAPMTHEQRSQRHASLKAKWMNGPISKPRSAQRFYRWGSIRVIKSLHSGRLKLARKLPKSSLVLENALNQPRSGKTPWPAATDLPFSPQIRTKLKGGEKSVRIFFLLVHVTFACSTAHRNSPGNRTMPDCPV